MKASGGKISRETVILFNEIEEEATVYTASNSIYKKMLKKGYPILEDFGDGIEFSVPKSHIKLPSPPIVRKRTGRKLSPDQIQKMQEGRKSIKNGL